MADPNIGALRPGVVRCWAVPQRDLRKGRRRSSLPCREEPGHKSELSSSRRSRSTAARTGFFPRSEQVSELGILRQRVPVIPTQAPRPCRVIEQAMTTQGLLSCRGPTSALMPVTATQPTMITVIAIRISLATPMMEGLMVSVWMWLMAPECEAARAKVSMSSATG